MGVKLTAAVLVGMTVAVMSANAAIVPKISPLKASGAPAVYPRVIDLTNLVAKTRINMTLAKYERLEQKNYSECIGSLRHAGQKQDKDSYWTVVSVNYLSSHYLGLSVNTELYCGGPHPDTEESTITFDLSTGREIDWKDAFKPGFLPPDGGTSSNQTSRVTALYRRYYPWTAKDEADLQAQIRKGEATEDDDCRKTIDEMDPFESPVDAIFHLEAGKGLVVEPDLAFAIRACDEEVALPPSVIAPYLKDTALLDEMEAISKRGAAFRGVLK